jgi:hypothetical protein
MDAIGRSFPFSFEHNHSIVMAGGKQIQRWMGGQNPEAIILMSEILNNFKY